jgi:probable HAF family extracellular repeat protein
LALGSGGVLFVADTGNSTIRAISPAGVVSTVAGQPYGADGVGSEVSFDYLGDIFADGAGNVYVTDQGGNTVRKIGPGGLVTTLAGLELNGGAADGLGSSARFSAPSGIAVNRAGVVYVADSDNHTIRQISTNGQVSTLAGLAGSPGSADGTGSAARFSYPAGLAVDGLGNVYVADHGNDTVRKITPSGVVTTLAGLAGVLGNVDGTGSAARFSYVEGLAVDGSNNLYCTDNQAVRVITPGGTVTTRAGLLGTVGTADGTGTYARFDLPAGIAVDATGNCFVADVQNGTIREVTPAGVVATVLSMAGYPGSIVDGTGCNARCFFPSAVAIDPSGHVWIADEGKVVREGAIATAAPGLTALPDSAPVTGGSVATLSVNVGASGPLTYQWYDNGAALADGGKISGSATADLSVANVQAGDQGTYRLIVSDSAGAISVTVPMMVVGPVPVITSQPTAQTVLAGATVTFNVAVTSGLTPTFQWEKDGQAISGATSSSYTLASVSAADIDAYSVIVTNASGSVTSDPARLVVNPTIAATPAYLVTDLGTLGGASSQAYGINASGQVVGSSDTSNGGTDAFLYSAGQMVDISNVTTGTQAWSINDSGEVVGFPTWRGFFTGQAFLYSGGVMTQLDGPGDSCTAIAINDAGQIAMTYSYLNFDGYGTPAAVLFSDGMFQNLTPPESTGSSAAGINAAGQVVGSSDNQACIFSDGQVQLLGTLGGGYSVGNGINAQGQVVGSSVTSGSVSSPYHAFWWNGSAMIDLGTLPGDLSSYGLALNSEGQIVGSSAGASDSRAFVVTGGVMADLNQLVQLSNGAAAGMVNLQSATGINDSGQIVGYGLSFDGSATHTHAFLLTPIVSAGVVAQSPSQTVTAGNPATFSVSAIGTAPITYQWMHNGTPINGATAASYAISAVQVSDSGAYTVVVTNPGGANVSRVMNLTVNFAHEATYLNAWSYSNLWDGSNPCEAVAYDGTGFVAVAANGAISSSPDGNSWTAVVDAGSAWGRLNAIVSLGGTAGLVAVGDGGAIVAISSSTLQTTLQASGSTTRLTGIATGAGRLVAVGDAGTILEVGVQGGTWMPAVSGTTANLNAIAYSGAIFVAVGDAGTVLTSTDGTTWTVEAIAGSPTLVSVAYGSWGFVAVSAAGLIYESSDGVAWTVRYSTGGPPLDTIAYGNGTFLATGTVGTEVISFDGGQTWQSAATNFEGLNATFGAGEFVIAGQYGNVAVSAPAVPGQLVNLSARAEAGAGDNALVAGFVIAGTGAKPILVRGIGPTLAAFNLTGLLPYPQLTLFDTSGAQLGTNSGWGGGAQLAQLFAQVNAFPLSPTSTDAALVQDLSGGFTAQVTGLNGTTGLALAEVYDAAPANASAYLVNLSARAQVGAGAQALIAGFVISGNTPKTFLIRAIGPTLAGFGIADALPDPRLTLFDANGAAMQVNVGWGGAPWLYDRFAQTGAFWLPANSKDSAIVVTLPPGTYTAQVDGASGDTGTALVEIYAVP